MPELISDDDPIFKVGWMRTSLQRDLLLLENQLPFRVLCKLFELIDEDPNRYNRLAFLACHFFGNAFHGLSVKIPENFQAKDAEHLLDLIHNQWTPQLRSAAVVNLPQESKENSLNRRFENEIVIEIIHHRRGLIVGIGIGILWPATKDIVEHGTLTIVEEGVANQEMEEKDMEADVEDDDFAAEHHVADEECCTGDCDWYADEEDTAG
nr:UPF0481 protein At3g47200-like [Ipomoea trifida]